MSDVRINTDAPIGAWQTGTCELSDIRVAAETRVWKTGFSLTIPVGELAARLDELPRDKLVVVARPNTDRLGIVRSYLTAKWFDIKCLIGGLLALADKLKGQTPQTFVLEPGR